MKRRVDDPLKTERTTGSAAANLASERLQPPPQTPPPETRRPEAGNASNNAHDTHPATRAYAAVASASSGQTRGGKVDTSA